MYGVFLGYRFAPGGTWNGEYLAEDLSDFRDVDFRYDAVGHSRSSSPHVPKQVELPSGGEIIFSLKKHFDRVDYTLDGH